MLLLKVLHVLERLGMMMADVVCAVLHSYRRRRVNVGLPDQDQKSKDNKLMGRLVKAIYRTRDVPLIWSDEVRKDVSRWGVHLVLHPFVFCKVS